MSEAINPNIYELRCVECDNKLTFVTLQTTAKNKVVCENKDCPLFNKLADYGTYSL